MDKKTRKILLIGGNSSVSRYVMPLFSNDYEIITVGRRDCDINLNPNKSLADQLPYHADVVIHTAAAFGRETDDEIYETEKYNVLDTMELCFHLKRMNVKHFLFISSIFVHLQETSPLYSIYNISKQHAEEVINYCLERDGIPFTILRPSQLYGKDPSFIKHHPFLYQIVETASKGEKLYLFGIHGGRANYLHIKDFAEVIYRVVKKRVFGVYDCVTKTPNTYLEIARSVYELTNNPVNIEFVKDKKESGQGFPFDDTIYKKIDYYPEMSIKDGLLEILNII
ncbi:NAD-dependent epimerase/dehydratase family protein [Winogradskyella alexanderae]|uniref:NAD(P)-dependent oxidoreductase n=1 Tax=Winogradskyella alexanderae TaxID=2877123 RepID=A0ABS7XS10_9FLAO|nr:NAD(P)-dependent oxidoreductase [Winogradskyella alexanderae]MCA0132812.1 NAD(P)-dependent oxidoreductase [Winogradskyella alexanderae]